VVAAACRIAAGSKETLQLGDLTIARDWGWAPEYVEAMWLMLQQDMPDDYVVATGKTSRLQDFVEAAFAGVGLDWRNHVVTDTGLARPNELRMSQGNPEKAHARLGWKAKNAMQDVVRLMIDNERTTVARVERT
jgi:GDPmannose 4,6-dehydratase